MRSEDDGAAAEKSDACVQKVVWPKFEPNLSSHTELNFGTKNNKTTRRPLSRVCENCSSRQ
jgi:hypothetical protein